MEERTRQWWEEDEVQEELSRAAEDGEGSPPRQRYDGRGSYSSRMSDEYTDGEEELPTTSTSTTTATSAPQPVAAAPAPPQRKEYPTTEHAVRTLALHTGLGYLLGLGVGLVGKTQSLFRAFTRVGHEGMQHYVDPFAVAGEFARPLFLVACLEVGSMYASPALHNMRLPRTPLSSTSTTKTPPSTSELLGERKEGDYDSWDNQSQDGYDGYSDLSLEKDDERTQASSKRSSTTQWDELARGTTGRKELYSEHVESDEDQLE